jgi:hypothetical protein
MRPQSGTMSAGFLFLAASLLTTAYTSDGLYHWRGAEPCEPFKDLVQLRRCSLRQSQATPSQRKSRLPTYRLPRSSSAKAGRTTSAPADARVRTTERKTAAAAAAGARPAVLEALRPIAIWQTFRRLRFSATDLAIVPRKVSGFTRRAGHNQLAAFAPEYRDVQRRAKRRARSIGRRRSYGRRVSRNAQRHH